MLSRELRSALELDIASAAAPATGEEEEEEVEEGQEEEVSVWGGAVKGEAVRAGRLAAAVAEDDGHSGRASLRTLLSSPLLHDARQGWVSDE